MRKFSKTSSTEFMEESIRQALLIKDELGIEDKQNGFRELSEKLGVDYRVIEVIMSLDEMSEFRKRNAIMDNLEKCKTRIITLLEECDEDDNIPWGPADDPSKLIHQAKKSEHNTLPFMDAQNEMTDAMRRRMEQSNFIATIDRYIMSCKSKVLDMQELIEWMSNFSFEVTWDEVGMSPVQQREKAEGESYRQMIQALQKAWQCTRKFQQLIHLLATDDSYDVLSGNLPPHIAAARSKRKGAPSVQKIWCSRKLRSKMDEYEHMRLKMDEIDKKAMNEQQKNAKAYTPTTQRQVTAIAPGGDLETNKNPYKETESSVLREIDRCWKEATDDVVFFMQEVKSHRFSKKSCRVRLERAMLMLEFIRAAVEGKVLEAERKEKMLEDTKAHVVRLQDETHQLNTKLAEAHKATQTAQRKITKLKRQLELVTKNNQKLQARIGEMKDKIMEQMKQIEELQELPNQQEFEENLQKIEDLEDELHIAEDQINTIQTELEERRVECDVVKGLLVQEKEMSASLSEDIVVLENENAKAQSKVAEIEKKMSEHESNVMSLRLMVYYKDEVIRRLKQAAIELKSSEKNRKIPKKPPPSPEDERPSGAKQPQTKKETSESGERKAISKAESKTSKQEFKSSTSKIDVNVRKVNEQSTTLEKPDGIPLKQPSVDVVTRLYEGAHRRNPSIKTTRVLIVSEDYAKLKTEHERALREIDATKRELQETRENFDYRLREGLETERHKSVLESMKTEEDLQFLCFTVKDETMRVQKEMRKFSENLSEELQSAMGFKGQICKNILPNTGGRTTGGLATNVNLEFNPMGRSTGYDSMVSGDMGILGMGGMMSDSNQMMDQMKSMMFGQEMSEMRGIDLESGRMTNNGFQIPMVGHQTELMGSNETAGIGSGAGVGQGVNYWKSLKTALTGKSENADQKQKENEQILEISDMLAQRRKAREEKRKSIEEPLQESETSIINTDSRLSNVDGCAPIPRQGALKTDEKSNIKTPESIQSSPSDDRGIIHVENRDLGTTEDNGRLKQHNHINGKIDKQKKVEYREITGQVTSIEQVGISQEEYSNQKESSSAKPIFSDVLGEKNTNTLNNNEEAEDTVQIRTNYLKPRNILMPTSERRASVFVDEKHTCGLGLLMERKRARLGDRRRSSVIPFRPPKFSVDARRQTIYEPDAPKNIKIKGFFGLGPAFDSDVSVKKSVKKLPKPKLPQEPEPLKQAEKFVRLISRQVADFLHTMNDNLTEVLKKHKTKTLSKMAIMEEEMVQEKLKFKAKLAEVAAENEKKGRELKIAQQTLMDIGYGLSSTSKLDVRSKLPNEIFQNLKSAEHELDNATQRFERAADLHKQNSEQYKKISLSVENKLTAVESENVELKNIMKKEKKISNDLRTHLYNIMQAKRHRLFLSLLNHKQNYNLLDQADDIDGDVKKVALSLLRKSMLYPEESLSLLVTHYCQHVKFSKCQERIRKQIIRQESSRKETRKTTMTQRKMNMLTGFLAGLAMRKELAKRRNAEKRKKLENERQKILIKMSLVLHKIKNDKKELRLVQPDILQVYGKGCGRSHNNTPEVQDFSDLQIFLPNRLAGSKAVKSSEFNDREQCCEKFAKLILRGRKPPSNLQRLKANVPHWFPDSSLFCPFSGRSGNIPPTNSHASVMHSKNPLSDKNIAGSYYQFHATRIDIPHIVELGIQTDLREAKKTVLRGLKSIPSSVSSCSMEISQSCVSQPRHQNTPILQQQMKYENYIWQNFETAILDRISSTKSIENLYAPRHCILPPLPTHPAGLMGLTRTSPNEVRLPEMLLEETASRSNFSQLSSSSSSPSLRSSNETTPGLPN